MELFLLFGCLCFASPTAADLEWSAAPPTPGPTPLAGWAPDGLLHGHATVCEAECVTAGHCCVGLLSACQKPSCAMGCTAALHTGSEAACNATCTAAVGAHPGSGGCAYALPNTNITFQMCGSCPAVPAPPWWPAAAKPPDGQAPGFWPPGYSLRDCSSCGDVATECMLGCMFHFRPSMKPVPPADPVPPPARPPPPPCGVFPSVNGVSGCVPGGDLNFSNVFGSRMVLQMQPAKAAVYGYVGTNASKAYGSAQITITVSPAALPVSIANAAAVEAGPWPSYSVDAVVDPEDGTWKAFLKPAAAGGSVTITAKCTAGCTGTQQLESVTFGDVWYCAGQSNMALPFQFSYARNASIAAIKKGSFVGDLRLTGLQGNMNVDQEWITLQASVGGTSNATMPRYGDIALDHFSSTCYYFGEALLNGLAQPQKVPVGLIHVAWGGSTIENWLTDDTIAECKGAGVNKDNEKLYDSNVKPYLDMSVKGFVFYQGENNAGGLHGNSGTAAQTPSGYGCMMPKLVELWRRGWSKVSGTTDPNAPFGIVSLSAHDSEGAQDMASFRWAQQGSMGTVPNKIMPNTFMAHGFDLQDPWNGNTGACLTSPLRSQGYDCTTPWYMGPSIHPRLKKPVGQRLALGALQSAYGQGSGSIGGVIIGCTFSAAAAANPATLTLRFDMKGRGLAVRPYNRSNAGRSATSVMANTTWYPVQIAAGAGAGEVAVDLSSLPAGATPSAVRYAWGGTASSPNGDDVSCCAGDGVTAPCVPVQCPLLATEPLAPFGGLPVDPFIAEIVAGGKCLCPEPQACSA